MKEEIQYYISSDGTKTPVKNLETTHLLNALNKKYRDIFNSANKDEVSVRLKEIDMLKNEYYRRLNDFNEKLGDK